MLVKCTPSASRRGCHCLPNKQSANYQTSRLHLSQPTLFDWMKHFLFGKFPLMILLVFSVQNVSFGQCNPDTQAPDALCISNFTLSLDGNGLASIDPNEIDGGSTDNCGIPDLTVSPNIVDCNDLVSQGGTGMVTVTLTATDLGGNTNSCTTDVAVVDNVAPVITCPDDIALTCGPGVDTTPANTGTATAVDNCTSPLSPTFSDATSGSGNCQEITRTWTVTDADGNTSTCDQIITVEDNVDPVIDFDASAAVNPNPPDPVTISCENAPLATPFSTAEDNCSGTLPVIVTNPDTQDPNPSNCGHYNYTVTRTWTATDACGNEDVETQLITVQDVTPPTLTGIPTSLNFSAGASCNMVVSGLDYSGAEADNCAPNSALTLSYTVTDLSDNSIVNSGIGLNANGLYNVGMYEVAFTAADPCNNSTTATITVTVADNVAPTAICHDQIQVSIPPIGFVDITHIMIDDNSFDNCPGTLTYEVDRLGVMPARVTCADVGTIVMDEVSLTVTDAGGNSSFCMTDIEVVDNSPPAMFCVDITIDLDINGDATITPADVDGGSNDACGPLSYAVNPSAFDCTDIGMNDVTLSVTDGNGNTGTCIAVVTVRDVTDPDANCTNRTVQLNASGTYTLTTTDINAIATGSSDNCFFTSEVSPSTFNCSDIGANPVTLTVTDLSDNTDTDACIVTVQDMIAPTAVCADFVAKVNQDCEVIVNAADFDNGSTDNCGTVTFTFQATGFQTQLYSGVSGPTPVTIDITDPSGNTSSCTPNLTVVDDKAPNAICVSGLTIALDGNGMVWLNTGLIDGGSYDNCSTVSLAILPDNLDCSNIATNPNIITLTVTDIYGNSSTCTTPITVQDNTAPSIWCPADVTIACQTSTLPSTTGIASAMDNCSATIAAPTYTDAVTFMPHTINGVVVTSEDCRTITRTWTAQDNGTPPNVATCQQIITVEDNTDPVWSPSNMATINSECNLSPNPPTASDNCNDPGDLIYVANVTSNSQVTDPNDCMHYRYTIITDWVAFDSCGNSTPVFIQTQNVDDTQAPTFSFTNNNLNFPNDAGSCAGTISLDMTPFVMDNCAAVANLTTTYSVVNDATGTVVNSGTGLDASGLYNAGDYTATFTADDPCNNGVTTLTINFTILDNESPTAICIPAGLQIVLNSSGVASVSPNTIDNGSNDNCNIQTMQLSPGGFNCTHVGTNVLVTLTIIDGAGHTNMCTTFVDVIDASPPVITCPMNQVGVNALDCSVDLNAYLNANPAMATTNCPGTTVSIANDGGVNTSGTSNHCRTVDVTWTATNTAGTATCVQTIDVVDNVNPTLVGVPNSATVLCNNVPAPASVSANDNCSASIAPAVTTVSTQNGDPATCGFSDYNITYTWTATDECGNSVTATRTFNVDNDTPVFNIPDPFVVPNDVNQCGAFVNLNLLDYITDCTPDANLTVTNDAFINYSTGNGMENVNGFYAVGSYPISGTVTDPCGATTNFNFTLEIADTQNPVAACHNGVTVVLDNTGNGSLTIADIDNSSTDNCGTSGMTYNITPNTFTSADVGTVNVTLTVTDAAGNTNTCITPVTVVGGMTLRAGGSAVGAPNSTVNVPVTADYFDNVHGVQFSWHLDNAPNFVGNVTGVTNINPALSGLAVSSGITISGNNLNVAWTSTTPVTLPNGTILFEVQVAIPATAPINDMSTLTIDGNPTPLQALQDFGSGTVSTVPQVINGTLTVVNSVPLVILAGNIAQSSNVNADLVTVTLSGSTSSTYSTITDGNYNFTVPSGSIATITPTKSNNYANGVNIFDMLLIQDHITFDPLNQLTTDCEKVAADVNNDMTINIFDLLEIQQVITMPTSSYPNSDSWEFAATDCDIASTTSHFAVPTYPNSISYTATQTMSNQLNGDFVAIKKGDVTGDAVQGQLWSVDDRSDETFYLTTNDVEMEAGQTYELSFRADEIATIKGVQMTFEFDAAALDFENVIYGTLPDLNDNSFNLDLSEEGKITMAWIGETTDLNADSELFQLKFVANTAATLSDVLTVNSSITPAIASDLTFEMKAVELTFESVTSTNPTALPALRLMQNKPNPFQNETIIGFELPTSSAATLTIMDVSGRVLRVVENNYQEGYHEILLKDLNYAGVLYYELKTPYGTATKKMVTTN